MEYNENSIKIFFRNFCDCILENENKIMNQRSKLYSFYCFPDSYGYFKYLDKNQKKYIDILDLSLFISINKIKCTKPQLNHILKKYDKDCDSCWNFSEYYNFICKDINIHFNNNNGLNESKMENYEKELVNLIEMEINYMKYIGIKIKALTELINSKTIDTKKIFNLIQKNSNKKDIDVNTLLSFVNDGNYHLKKEEIYKIIQVISGGKNSFTEKQLDNIFKYDKYINNSELKYPKLYKGAEDDATKSSLKKYEGEFPINNCGIMRYNVYKNSKEVKEKNMGNIEKIKEEFNNSYKNDINNLNNNNENSFNKEGNNNYYNTYGHFMNNNHGNNNLLLNSNNSITNPNEFHSLTLSQFSFRK